jgi:putative oxidoreductase
MSLSIPSSDVSKARTIGFWLLKIVLAATFLGAGVFKLSGDPVAVAEFDQVGFGQWFRTFTAFMEIAGAALLLWPRTVFFGALLMGAVCVGAFFAQLLALHGDVIHTIVLAAICAAIAWNHRAQLNAVFTIVATPRS